MANNGCTGNLSTQLSTCDKGQFEEEPDEGQTFTSGSEAEHGGVTPMLRLTVSSVFTLSDKSEK
jgi:hypothetical protein